MSHKLHTIKVYEFKSQGNKSNNKDFQKQSKNNNKRQNIPTEQVGTKLCSSYKINTAGIHVLCDHVFFSKLFIMWVIK